MSATVTPLWRLRRLMAMGPAEIGLRVSRGLAHRSGRRREPMPQSEFAVAEDVLADPVAPEDVSQWVASELTRGRGRLLPGARDADGLRAILAELGTGTSAVDAADAILRGNVPAFGWTEIATGTAPDWHEDPSTGGRWPLVYWADIDFRSAPGLGDPRYVWEVNRHHHLVTLARAYVLTGEPRYADRVWRDIRSWIDANPPLFGINWSSSLEIALRLMSWAMALDLLGSDGARDGDSAAVTVSVSLQAVQLSDNLSVYASSRNNHLIGEAAGLLVAGAKFPFLRRGDAFGMKGKALLERELSAQVSADGVDREQTFHYGAFVAEFALLSMAACACLGTSLAPDSVEKLGKMARFLAAVGGSGGIPPSVGDEDGGRAYELSEGTGRQAARAAACALAASGGRVPEGLRGDLEPAVWLFGPDMVRAALEDRGGEESKGEESSFFPEGGYFVPAGGGQHGVIDCGPLGYLSIAAHGHADCLSLSVCHQGRWLLVDPGTYSYHRDALWRDHFRSTAAHNTVCVDGTSQSEMTGPFMWGRRATASQRVWAVGDTFDYFEGAHDGYGALGASRHTRSIVHGKRGYWLIVDRIEGSGRHTLSSTFQLGEGLRRLDAEGWIFEDEGGVGLELRSWLPAGFEMEMLEGRESPPGGWVSSGFGHRTAAPAVVARGEVELPATLVFAVIPYVGERDIWIDSLTDGWQKGAMLEARFPEGRDWLLLGSTSMGSVSFDGRLGLVAERECGTETSSVDVTRWTSAGANVERSSVKNLMND